MSDSKIDRLMAALRECQEDPEALQLALEYATGHLDVTIEDVRRREAIRRAWAALESVVLNEATIERHQGAEGPYYRITPGLKPRPDDAVDVTLAGDDPADEPRLETVRWGGTVINVYDADHSDTWGLSHWTMGRVIWWARVQDAGGGSADEQAAPAPASPRMGSRAVTEAGIQVAVEIYGIDGNRYTYVGEGRTREEASGDVARLVNEDPNAGVIAHVVGGGEELLLEPRTRPFEVVS